jgi:D-alanine--poly(phosphoribitol) ligase subunit 1
VDLLACIDRWGREEPSRVAFDGSGRLTYGELRRGARRLAAHLRSVTAERSSPVAIVGHKEPDVITGMVASALAGLAFVPIDSTLPIARREHIRKLAGGPITLTPDLIQRLIDQAVPGVPMRWAPDGARPFYVMFTSGSTGDPKGIVITYGNLRHFLTWMLGEHAPTSDDVFLNVVPYSFDVSVMDTWLALATGARIVAVTREHRARPLCLRERLQASGATIWVSTPSFARLCLADPLFTQALLPALRTFLFCGETLTPQVAGALLDRFPATTVWNTYGPTEATVAATSVRIDRALLGRYPVLPIGREMPGSRVIVVGENVVGDDLRPLPEGEQGEIVIAGPNVSPGYLGRPDLTARAFGTFEGQPSYRTGDLGRQRDGLLFFEGRADDQVKVDGFRIELGDVEAHLGRLPGVRDVAVVLRERNGRADSLAAFVVPQHESGSTQPMHELTLRTALAGQLPSYMLPRTVRFLDTLPLTPNGKVDRRALLDAL